MLPLVIWYIVFVGAIPYTLIRYAQMHYLRLYLPVIDLIANVFTSSSSFKNRFRDLYVPCPNNIVSYISTNFISLLALLGISINLIPYVLKNYIKKDLIVRGLELSVFMYTITYLLPTMLIPVVINWFQGLVHEWWPAEDKSVAKEAASYAIGAVMVIGLMVIEHHMIIKYVGKL